MSSPIVSKNVYYLIFATLMVFTGITVWVAFSDLGPLNTPVAIGIAIFKATLVILYFMHVKYSPRLTKLVVVSSIFWLVILLLMTMGDYLTRDWRPYGWNLDRPAYELVQDVRSVLPDRL